MDLAHEGLVVSNTDGVVLLVNEWALALLPPPPPQVVGRLVWEVDHQFTRARWEALVETLREQGTFVAERTRKGEDGAPDIYEASAQLVRDGEAEYVVSHFRNVTAARRWEAERRAREADERTRAIEQARLEGLGQRINEIELVMTAEGAIIVVNDRAVEAYGWSRETLLTLNIRDLRPGHIRGDVAAAMARVIQEGGLRFRTEHQRADGRVFSAEVSSRPFRVGDTTYLHSIVRDLTAELRADADQRLLAGLISNMHDAVIVTDLELRVTRFMGDAAQIYGVTEAEAIGHNPFTELGADGSVDVSQDVLEPIARCETARTIHRALRRDGTHVDLDVITTPLRSAQGETTGYLLVSRDVTAQKAMERELRDALQNVKTLGGLVPICAWCKKIRNDEGYWDRLEHYLTEHTNARFSHGMCPECAAKWGS